MKLTAFVFVILFSFTACEKESLLPENESSIGVSSTESSLSPIQNSSFESGFEDCECDEGWAPVCTADGELFPNACIADCLGITDYEDCDIDFPPFEGDSSIVFPPILSWWR